MKSSFAAQMCCCSVLFVQYYVNVVFEKCNATITAKPESGHTRCLLLDTRKFGKTICIRIFRTYSFVVDDETSRVE